MLHSFFNAQLYNNMNGIVILCVIILIAVVVTTNRASESMLATRGRFRLGSYDPNMYGGITTPPQMRQAQPSFYTA